MELNWRFQHWQKVLQVKHFERVKQWERVEYWEQLEHWEQCEPGQKDHPWEYWVYHQWFLPSPPLPLLAHASLLPLHHSPHGRLHCPCYHFLIVNKIINRSCYLNWELFSGNSLSYNGGSSIYLTRWYLTNSVVTLWKWWAHSLDPKEHIVKLWEFSEL